MWARPSGLRTFEATFAFTFITARRLVVFPRETLSIGFRVLVSRHPAIQTTGLLTFAPAGLSPAEHASLRWTHTRTCRFPASGSSRESFARVGVEDAVRDSPVEKRTEVMMSRRRPRRSRNGRNMVRQVTAKSRFARAVAAVSDWCGMDARGVPADAQGWSIWHRRCVTAAQYEANLEVNLLALLERIKSGRYVAPPVRRVYIPKADGSVEAGPVERASSTMPSRQPFLPQHHDLAGEPSYASRVARYAVVGIVASRHLGQMSMLIAQGSMPIASAPIAYCRQRPCVPAFGRHLPHPVHPLL